MNPFLNPINGIPAIKNFIFDPGRLRTSTPKDIERYRDKAFKKIVKYAYTVPLYHDKYKKAGIHPSDIKGMQDVTKLPFITKKDITNNYPNNIIPTTCNTKNVKTIGTSGSSGKPITIYTDFYTLSKVSMCNLRTIMELGLNWRKTKYAHIGNFSANHPDSVAQDLFLKKTSFLFSSSNLVNMNAYDPIEETLKKLDRAQPDIIISYPATLHHLAFLKKKGYGRHIHPKILLTGGSVLDEYTKQYVEDAFECKVYNIYSSTESGAEISFECVEGTWHINYDFFHVEAIDENMDVVSPDERGLIVLTRLFGRGTPIIRYTGMKDWISISQTYNCNCGLYGPILKDGVEGRASATIVLPDGRVLPSFQSYISILLNNLKAYKIKQFQIIQKKINEIVILLVIDEDLRDSGPSVDFIFDKIKETYQREAGPNVKINVKEIKEIKSRPDKPAPLVISHVNLEEGYELLNKKNISRGI